MGSVKDLTILEAPGKERPGKGRFVFSDRYSVFDWGEMPDHINLKGTALCMAAAYFFEKLEEIGIQTHYLGLVEEGEVKNLSKINSPVNTLETKIFRVLKPVLTNNGTYDYKIYKEEKGNLLIPLEVIYRNSLPAGSSVFKRLKKGELKPDHFGLSEIPREGIDLKHPYLDVSTKLEATDRYLSWQEAQNISHLTNQKVAELSAITLRINQMISKEAKRMGLKNEDGKFEFALDQNKKIVLVDVLGTLDECRFTFQGMPVSKEIARLYYRKSKWYKNITRAKEIDNTNWKQYVKNGPDPMPSRLNQLISMVYCAFTNKITGKEWFKDVLPLRESLKEIQEFI